MNSEEEICTAVGQEKSSAFEVFFVFLRLGLTSFGGPIAHLGYFRRELVEKRRWLGESDFAQLLALCQFLPGPASSQLGFSLGLLRGGFPGAIAAFTAFTVPSALLLFVFAEALPLLSGPLGAAAIHGLKLVALSVVAHGVIGMGRRLCPDLQRLLIGLVAAAAVLLVVDAWFQLFVVVAGGLAGMLLCRGEAALHAGSMGMRYGTKLGYVLLLTFFLLLFLLPFMARGEFSFFTLADALYQSGALVFGGGHVVLPLLEVRVVDSGWLSEEQFLAGYGAAQAIPGPMFSFAAYLGGSLEGGYGGLAGAAVALISIFAPGFLLVSGILPLWSRIARLPLAGSFIAGVNAAVVGLLTAALYDPIYTSSVSSPADLLLAAIGLLMLLRWGLPSIFVVLWCLSASIAVALLPTLYA